MNHLSHYCVMCGKGDYKKLFRVSFNILGNMTGEIKITCLDCLKSIDKKKFEKMEEIILQKEFCSQHNEQKDCYIRNSNGKWQKYCFSCEKEKWEQGLQRFKLNPLSIAKYFYEKWKVSDPIIMQRLIYFSYLEILKEKDIVLFEENFQAWPGGPVLESIIYPMYKNYEELKGFFAGIRI